MSRTNRRGCRTWAWPETRFLHEGNHMYKRILLCSGGSREGRAALREGGERAAAIRAETHLLAILRPLASTVVPEGITHHYVAQEQEAARCLLDEGVRWLRGGGVPARGSLVFGDPLDEIPAAAKRLSVDLIVMGHRPLGRLARWWAGPGGAQMLDRVTCSMLVAIGPDESPAA